MMYLDPDHSHPESLDEAVESGDVDRAPAEVSAKEAADNSKSMDRADLPGVIAALGDLGPGAIITEEGVRHLFHRHASSVKRAVQRGELPPPMRLFGQQTWTAGAIVRHIESRLEQAAKKKGQLERRISQKSP